MQHPHNSTPKKVRKYQVMGHNAEPYCPLSMFMLTKTDCITTWHFLLPPKDKEGALHKAHSSPLHYNANLDYNLNS